MRRKYRRQALPLVQDAKHQLAGATEFFVCGSDPKSRAGRGEMPAIDRGSWLYHKNSVAAGAERV